MYSNNQWSFNPAVYQNIPYEQVDWASLAQQWIKMKETVPTTTQGSAPPSAPSISKDTPVPTPTRVPSQPSNDIEGGEAPMDMDTKDDEATTPTVGAAGTSGNWNQWSNWQTPWGWGWSGNSGSVPSTENTPSATSNVDSKVKSTNNDSIAALNDVRNFPIVGNSATTTQVSSTFNYNNTGGTVIPPIIPKSNYSFNNTFPPAGKSSSEHWHKAGKSSNRQMPPKSTPPEQFPVLDAAKKKQLPAWIREGLNKMEREKQKKMERERMVQEKHIMDHLKSDYNEPEPEPASMPIYVEEPPLRDPPPVMQDYGRRYSPEPPPSYKYQKRRSPSIPRQRSREPQALRKTKDQIMEESMLKVRRILTEILLEATERQVQLIAKEEHRRYRASASAPQIRKSNALTSLTGNLGLDVYDSEDNSSDGERDRDDDIDSDEELKMTIEKKKRDFTLVEDEIDRLVEDQEARERLIAQRDSRDEDDIDDDANEDDEEDEPRARNSRDKDIGGPVSHQRYPDHDRERQPDRVESRSVDEDRNDYRSANRRNPSTSSITSEPKHVNGDTKSVPKSDAAPVPVSTSTETPVEDPARASKKDDSSSTSTSSSSSSQTSARADHRTGRSQRSSTKRSSRRSRSSSSSSSSSTSSSSSSSRQDADSKSSSDDDDDDSPTTDDSKSKRDKRKKSDKSRKKPDTEVKSTSTSSKKSKRRSSDDSDSDSRRSRYKDTKDGKSSSSSSYKRTNPRNTDSVERSRRRRSPSYRRRSPSYHRSSSRRDYSSKYKDSPSSSSSRSRRRGADDYSPESKRSRYRSSSRESSRYKRR